MWSTSAGTELSLFQFLQLLRKEWRWIKQDAKMLQEAFFQANSCTSMWGNGGKAGSCQIPPVPKLQLAPKLAVRERTFFSLQYNSSNGLDNPTNNNNNDFLQFFFFLSRQVQLPGEGLWRAGCRCEIVNTVQPIVAMLQGHVWYHKKLILADSDVAKVLVQVRFDHKFAYISSLKNLSQTRWKRWHEIEHSSVLPVLLQWQETRVQSELRGLMPQGSSTRG